MAKNVELLSKDYDGIKITLGADVSAGDYGADGVVHGFYLTDGSDGDEAFLVTKAHLVKCPKQAALAIGPGDAVYYDTTEDEVDKTNTNELVGYCVEDAAAADTHVLITWDGFAEFLKS